MPWQEVVTVELRHQFVHDALRRVVPVTELCAAYGISRTTEEMVAELEQRIDRYMSEVELPPQFVIPGGNQLSAQLDVARTVIRRAERRIAALAEEGELASETVIHFVNRASDLAFAMARYADVKDPALFQGRERST